MYLLIRVHHQHRCLNLLLRGQMWNLVQIAPLTVILIQCTKVYTRILRNSKMSLGHHMLIITIVLVHQTIRESQIAVDMPTGFQKPRLQEEEDTISVILLSFRSTFNIKITLAVILCYQTSKTYKTKKARDSRHKGCLSSSQVVVAACQAPL
jgi:hypothetical protein